MIVEGQSMVRAEPPERIRTRRGQFEGANTDRGLWHPISPSEPVPKSRACAIDWMIILLADKGRSTHTPSQRSQLKPLGTGSETSGRGAVSPSRCAPGVTSLIADGAGLHQQHRHAVEARGVDLDAIWVTRPFQRANSVSFRAS